MPPVAVSNDGRAVFAENTLTHPLAKVENLRPVFQPTLHAGYRL